MVSSVLSFAKNLIWNPFNRGSDLDNQAAAQPSKKKFRTASKSSKVGVASASKTPKVVPIAPPSESAPMSVPKVSDDVTTTATSTADAVLQTTCVVQAESDSNLATQQSVPKASKCASSARRPVSRPSGTVSANRQHSLTPAPNRTISMEATNDENVDSNVAPETMETRRAAFDLLSSLAKPLGWKLKTGRVRPLEVSESAPQKRTPRTKSGLKREIKPKTFKGIDSRRENYLAKGRESKQAAIERARQRA